MIKSAAKFIWKNIRKRKIGRVLVSSPEFLRLMEKVYKKIYPESEVLYDAKSYKIFINSADGGIARRYLIEGEHEGFSKDWIRKTQNPKIFYDIGANVGDWTLSMASSFPECRVFSFEPHPILFQQMTRSIGINGFPNVVAYNFGLGSNEESHTLHCDPKNQGNNSICVLPESDNVTEIAISVKRASDFVKYDGCRPTLIKLDVQGFEFEILKDLTDPLLLKHCEFMIEIDKNTSTELLGWIKCHIECGKLIEAIDEFNKRIIRVTDIGQLLDLVKELTYFDILIKSNEK